MNKWATKLVEVHTCQYVKQFNLMVSMFCKSKMIILIEKKNSAFINIQLKY
jgi:hypothetical protein